MILPPGLPSSRFPADPSYPRPGPDTAAMEQENLAQLALEAFAEFDRFLAET